MDAPSNDGRRRPLLLEGGSTRGPSRSPRCRVAGGGAVTVLVTGGAGFIGAEVVRELVARADDEVHVTYHSGNLQRLDGVTEQVTLHRLDLGDAAQVNALVDGGAAPGRLPPRRHAVGPEREGPPGVAADERLRHPCAARGGPHQRRGAVPLRQQHGLPRRRRAARRRHDRPHAAATRPDLRRLQAVRRAPRPLLPPLLRPRLPRHPLSRDRRAGRDDVEPGPVHELGDRTAGPGRAVHGLAGAGDTVHARVLQGGRARPWCSSPTRPARRSRPSTTTWPA